MNDKPWKEMFVSMWEREGNPSIQFQLDDGVEINALNTNDKTLLSHAAALGNMELIEFLVQHGADGNVTDSDGSMPLHIAAKCGHMDAVKFFLDKGIFINSRNKDGNSPLLLAAFYSQLSVVEYLIESEADVECRCQYGWTILHYACGKGWLGLVKSLVNKGCDFNAETNNGRTPLRLAADDFSNVSIVEYLIELGANVECRDQDGYTLLHCACMRGWLGVVKSLVSKGCDFNAKTSDGKTPLSLAADDYSYVSIVEYLIASGADVECRGKDGSTMLHYACGKGWLGVVKSLVSKGCDFNVKNSYGLTPLLLAAAYSKLSIVEYLIGSGAECRIEGADVWGSLKAGWTVLHYACDEGWLGVVKTLISKGCDVNAKDHCHNTPFHYAVQNWKLEIVECLLKAGKKGVYITFDDYIAITKEPLLKQSILQDTELCTQSVLNKFNNFDLPKIYEIPVLAEILPAIENFKIARHSDAAQDIARRVMGEIQTNGYCNVLNVRPLLLSSLCVGALSEFCGN